MHVTFIYPSFERHAKSHPVLLEYVPCDEYLGSPSLGIAQLASVTPDDVTIKFIDDRITPFDPYREEADLFALSFFTPAAMRGMEIGRALLARGKKVVMGGIFPSMMPGEVAASCTSVVIGEGEPVWKDILNDARHDTMKPVYRATEPFDLATAAPPKIDLYIDAEKPAMQMDDYPLQASRGCPLSCFACALPGVMGKKFRFFSEDTNIQAALNLYARNKRICITEDTSFLFLGGARRRFKKFLLDLWERTDHAPIRVSYMGISMPMVLSLEDDFMEIIRRVGIRRFYLVGGFDPITQKAFGTGDREALGKAELVIKRCHEYGIEPYTSMLVGTELDDEAVFDRMLEFGNATGLEKTEFAIATPYPGTPAWHQMAAENRLLHRNWTKYNDANVVFRPKHMNPERLQEGYLYLWKEFYRTRQHLRGLDHDQCTIQF